MKVVLRQQRIVVMLLHPATLIKYKKDNLWTIPKKLKVNRADFMSVNGFDSSTILQIGQEVKIPGKGGNVYSEAPAVEPTTDDLFAAEDNTTETPLVGDDSTTVEAPVGEIPTNEPTVPAVTDAPVEAPAVN